jgi:tetratricopeptide (TPR) repeat protein
MVLNSLGGVYQRQGRFAEAVEIFDRSYKLLVELEDQRGQAMVLNSLGGVLRQQRRFEAAVGAFEHSIAIGERLNDRRHLAMVYTALGKTLLSQGLAERAAAELHKGFAIDERLKNQRGVGVVAPSLIRALTRLGQRDEALGVCRRALALAPQNKELLELHDQLGSPQQPPVDRPRMQGAVKRTLRHQQGYLYGFIAPDDSSPDIYFRESDLLPESLPMPAAGERVEFNIDLSHDGRRRARNVKRLI